MEKVELKLEQIKDELFSPGNIYWKKKSGEEVLVSGKSDILNLKMLQKLFQSNSLILIEDAIDFSSHEKIIQAFNNYKTELLIPKKLQWRSSINTFLLNDYYHSSRSQFDLNQLCWKLFSKISKEQSEVFINRDRDYFLRSISIATSYTLCAYLLGHYSERYLTQIYNSTLLSQMEIGKSELISELKNRLEDIRQKESLTTEDKDYLKSIIDSNQIEQCLYFLKDDGSGVMPINKHELSDMELVLTSLNFYYHFGAIDSKNILADIKEGKFKTNPQMVNIFKRNFRLIEEKSAVG